MYVLPHFVLPIKVRLARNLTIDNQCVNRKSIRPPNIAHDNFVVKWQCTALTTESCAFFCPGTF